MKDADTKMFHELTRARQLGSGCRAVVIVTCGAATGRQVRLELLVYRIAMVRPMTGVARIFEQEENIKITLA